MESRSGQHRADAVVVDAIKSASTSPFITTSVGCGNESTVAQLVASVYVRLTDIILRSILKILGDAGGIRTRRKPDLQSGALPLCHRVSGLRPFLLLTFVHARKATAVQSGLRTISRHGVQGGPPYGCPVSSQTEEKVTHDICCIAQVVTVQTSVTVWMLVRMRGAC